MRNFLFIFYLSFSFVGNAQQAGRIELLDANAFDAKTQHIKGALLDVRSSEEFNEGHLENAKNIDWNEVGFKAEVKKLPLNQPVFMYCAGGFRSGEAAKWMQEAGFRNLIVLEDGYDHWKELGKKVVIPSKPTPEN